LKTPKPSELAAGYVSCNLILLDLFVAKYFHLIISILQKQLQSMRSMIRSPMTSFLCAFPFLIFISSFLFSHASVPVVFLYGALGSAQTVAFHNVLKQKADAAQIKYIFRHSLLDLSENPDSPKLSLNGMVSSFIPRSFCRVWSGSYTQEQRIQSRG
jgi:hypothetical protein